MTMEKYNEIWSITDKAFKYLYKKGNRGYYSTSIENACGTYCLIKYCFANVTESQKRHVAKVYPNALIVYTDKTAVDVEEEKRTMAFAKYLNERNL